MRVYTHTACLAHDTGERGMWLSFPGVITYKNAPYLSEALKVTPVERILVENEQAVEYGQPLFTIE